MLASFHEVADTYSLNLKVSTVAEDGVPAVNAVIIGAVVSAVTDEAARGVAFGMATTLLPDVSAATELVTLRYACCTPPDVMRSLTSLSIDINMRYTSLPLTLLLNVKSLITTACCCALLVILSPAASKLETTMASENVRESRPESKSRVNEVS